MSLPPPPPGYDDGDTTFAPRAAGDASNLMAGARADDPLHSMLSVGAVVTNAIRTPADTARLRAQGYTPAQHSLHLNGDAIDLVPGKTGWSLTRLAAEAKKNFGDSFSISVHNGTHVHISKPGWGGGLPAPPEGFDLSHEDGGLPPPPPGYDHAPEGTTAPPTPPPGAPKMTDDQFTQSAGAIASDPALPPAERVSRLRALAEQAGKPIDDADLQRLAEAGRGVVQYQAGANGKVGSLVALEPAPPPGPDAPGTGPTAVLDPRKQGLNHRVRAMINNGKTTPKMVWDYLKQFGVDPAVNPSDMSLVPQVAKVFQWRRENPGRPYTGHISLEEKINGGTAPTAPPPETNEEANQAILDTAAGGRQTLSGPYTPDHPFGRNTKERVWKAASDAGFTYPDRIADETSYLPLIGGAESIDQAKQDFHKGDYGTAAMGVVLGAADFLPGGKGVQAGVHVLDGAALREASRAADGAVDVGRAGEHLRSTVDTAMDHGGEITLYAGTEPRRIIGSSKNGLIDDTGKVWEANSIVSPTNGNHVRVEINLPHAVQGSGAVAEEGAHNVSSVDDGAMPPTPDGYVDEPVIGRTRRTTERASSGEIASAAQNTLPEDVTPIPASHVASADEAAAASSGKYPPVVAPDETSELGVRDVGKTRVRGPLDMTQRLRTLGGVRDDGGELAHLGIDGTPRRMPFGSNEQFLGKLVTDRGMHLDDAAHALWEEGYFPGFTERPTPADLIDRLHQENTGTTRFFHPDDLEEVSRFQGAQSERGAVEQAESEGSPLVHDRGEPINHEDLEANKPPVTAYEDLPTLGGKVANLNLDKIETTEDIRRALQTTEAKFGGFDAARRGQVSHAETSALADELGMTPDDLLKRRQGQAFNAEQALASRRILAKSAEELVSLAKKVRGGSEEEVAAFQRALIRHAAIQEQVTGATAEAGRALQQFKILANSKDARVKVLKNVIDANGGKGQIEDVAAHILDLEADPGQLNKFALMATKPRWKDKLVELWYNSLLSGPKTHVVNIMSNTLATLGQVPEHAVAAGLGSIRHLTSQAVNDRVLFSEVGARAAGWVSGLREGLGEARKSFLSEETSDLVSKIDGHAQAAISGTKGKIIRLPTRMLSAEDELFKAMARKMEISGLAIRQAKSEANLAKASGRTMSSDAIRQRAAELAANPPEPLMAKAFEYGRYVTFQRPLTGFPQTILAATNKHPLLKVVVPFVRTPTNLFKYSFERSPLAPLVADWRADIRAGGARRDLAAARAMMGTAVAASVVMWAAEDKITGSGPADPSAKRLLMADGWQPFSIRIGDHYVSYERMDPFALLFGTAADLATKTDHMTSKQREHSATILAASVMQQMQNKTWLQGISDVVQAMNDPRGWQGKAGAWASQTAGSVVPAFVAQAAQAVDPVSRQTSGAWEKIKSRIPFASKSLPGRPDVWGRDMPGVGGSPLRLSERKNDPVTNELLSVGARFGMPSKKAGGVDLKPEQYTAYVKRSGQLTYEWISTAMDDDGWRTMDDASKRQVVDAIKNDARTTARAELFPELMGNQTADQ